MFKVIMKQSFIVILLKIFTSANALSLTYLISSEFGASTTGVYFFIISLLSFLSSLSTLGLPMSLLSKLPIISENMNEVRKVVMNSFFICLSSSFILIVGLFVITFIYKHEILSEYFWYISISIFPFSFVLIMSTCFQSIGKLSYAMLCLSGGYQIFLTLLLILIPSSNDINLLLSCFLISIFAINILSFFYIFRLSFFSFKLYESFYYEMKKLSFYSIDFMATNVLGQMSNFLIVFLLSIFSMPQNIGLYSVALRVALLVSFISFSLNKVIAPNISKFYMNKRYSDLYRMINISYFFTLSFVIPICLFLIFSSDFILKYFGEEFLNASPILVIISIGQLIASIAGINSFLLQMTGNQKVMQKLTFRCVLVTSFLDVPLIFFWEEYGAALAYSFNLILISFFTMYYVYKKIGYFPLMRVSL